jgi:pimeloyl-ACP methyl ester carboxylesterase
MDYHRPLNASEDNPKVHIALLLAPGNHTGSEKHSKSPLLLNPGGPGGSGTLFAAVLGERIHYLVGGDQDVIGFDPRGIGSTTPRADCFSYRNDYSGNEGYQRGNLHRMVWQMAGTGIGHVNSSADSLYKLDTRARTIAKLCEEKDSIDGKDSILKYAHTPSVARDMISIIDAWDEWTESSNNDSTDEDIQGEVTHKENFNGKEDSDIPDTKGKLLYWGFSYGVLNLFLPSAT